MNRLPSLSGRKKSEIVDMLLREEYGYFPSLPIDVSVSANIENKNFCAGKAVLEKLCFKCESAIGEYSFETFFAYPKNKDKSPCFIHINFAAEVPHRLQPTEELIDNGYAVMTVCHKNISSDDGDFKNGIAGIIYRDGERGELDCGKIGIWAFTKENFDDMTEAERSAAPRPMFESSTWSFGKVKKGTVIHASYTFRNQGKTPLKVYKVDADTQRWSHGEIPVVAGGQTGSFKVDLDTQGMPSGEVLVIVTLTTNSPLRPIVNLFIAGYIE